MRKIALSIAAAGFGLATLVSASFAAHHGGAHEADKDKKQPAAEVYIISPADGDEIEGPVEVVFGLNGMGVAPAGVEHKNTGHHHLLIDRKPPSKEEMQDALPASDLVKHYGGGQTQTELALAPGEHTLQLLFADHNHIPFDPVIISDRITITVLAPSDDDDEDKDEDEGDDSDEGDDDNGDDDDKEDGGLLDRLF